MPPPQPQPPPPPSVPAGAPRPQVPRVIGLRADGEPQEPGWLTAFSSGPFLAATGEPARPHSELRLAHDGEFLHLLLYAADEDIETRDRRPDGPVWLDDAFQLQLRADNSGPVYAVDVSAAGVITDARTPEGGRPDLAWQSGARAEVEHDGTLNSAQDDDEEWLVELSIPLKTLGLVPGKSVHLSATRCDVPKGGRRLCGGWQALVDLKR